MDIWLKRDMMAWGILVKLIWLNSLKKYLCMGTGTHSWVPAWECVVHIYRSEKTSSVSPSSALLETGSLIHWCFCLPGWPWVSGDSVSISLLTSELWDYRRIILHPVLHESGGLNSGPTHFCSLSWLPSQSLTWKDSCLQVAKNLHNQCRRGS